MENFNVDYDLFKFLLVRPPLKHKRYVGQRVIDVNHDSSEVAKIVINKGFKAGVVAAKDFLDSERFVQHNGRIIDLTDKLRYEVLEGGRIKDSKEFAKWFKDVSEQSIKEYLDSKDFETIRQDLTESLAVSAMNIDEIANRDQSYLVNAISTLNALVEFNKNGDFDLFKIDLKKAPVVSLALAQSKMGLLRTERPDEVDYSTDLRDREEERVEIELIKKELAETNLAITEIEYADDKTLREREDFENQRFQKTKTSEKRKSSEKSRTTKETDSEATGQSDSQVFPPRILSDKTFKNLSESSKKLLNRKKIDPKEQNTLQVIESLQRASEDLHLQLFRKTNKVHIVRLGGNGMQVVEVDFKGRKEYKSKKDINFNHHKKFGQQYAVGDIKPLGIGDLKIVRQHLKRYEMGEIAHIENVMSSEERERTHRKLTQEEETLFQESIEEKIEENDLSTNERFELQQETERTIQTDSKFEAGVDLTASYGPVKFSANTNYSTSSSLEESRKVASSYAKDVTERSLKKIVEKNTSSRKMRFLKETEEFNKHAFSNGTEEHISGIYRYVDKVFSNQIYNYGKRLMFEFIIPEPAAFYLHSLVNRESIEYTIPDSPAKLDIENDITPSNYTGLVTLYNASGVSTPPPKKLFVGFSTNHSSSNGNNELKTESNKIVKIPKGYETIRCWKSFAWTFKEVKDFGPWISVHVGKVVIPHDSAELTHYQEEIPIAILSNVGHYVLNLEIECNRTAEHLLEWKNEVYDALMTGWKSQVLDVEEKIKQQSIQQGISIQGKNPLTNQKIERNELKRACLNVITDQSVDFNAISTNRLAFPQTDLTEIKQIKPFIQFFEQAFEWNNMTFSHYPYFWGRMEEWINKIHLEENDPNFLDFLQAGATKVVIPARLSYEKAVLHFINTGYLWQGGEPPELDDPLYISIVEELKFNERDDEAKEGDPWETKVPTPLVLLQSDSELPKWEVE